MHFSILTQGSLHDLTHRTWSIMIMMRRVDKKILQYMSYRGHATQPYSDYKSNSYLDFEGPPI